VRDPWDDPAYRHIMRELQRQQSDPTYRHIMREIQREQNDPARQRVIREVQRQQNDPAHRYAMEEMERRQRDPTTKLLATIGLRTRPEERLVAQMSAMGRADHLSLFESARSASSSTLNILNDLRPRISAVEQLNAVSPSWRREVEDLRRLHSLPDVRIESALGVHLTRITERTLLAQDALAGIHRRDVGAALGVADATRRAVENRFVRFADSYSRLFESFEHPRTSILTLPPRLSELPAVEFFNGIDLLRATSFSDEPEDEFEEDRQDAREEIAGETDGALPALLSKLNPELLRLWEGARQARRSSNPDRVRHFATSLRELLTHVLHQLSPDDELRTWSSSAADFANNRPTRKARLRFIAREIDHGPFTEFVEKDINATLAAFNLFHAGTHAISSRLTEPQLAALQAKVESAIYFMIMTARGDQEGGH
jgi:hypothetical protein